MTDAFAKWIARRWRASEQVLSDFVAHRDPLAEASNWVAVTIGTHLPLWPLYVWWSAGNQAWPAAALTAAMTPVFLAIPVLSQRNGLFGRIAMPIAGIANTVWTIWILGMASGTALFLAPCAVLAAWSFRRAEWWLMIPLTILPLLIWTLLLDHAPAPMHLYDPGANARLYALNGISVSVLLALFGWLQTTVYRRMESAVAAPNPRTDRAG